MTHLVGDAIDIINYMNMNHPGWTTLSDEAWGALKVCLHVHDIISKKEVTGADLVIFLTHSSKYPNWKAIADKINNKWEVSYVGRGY